MDINIYFSYTFCCYTMSLLNFVIAYCLFFYFLAFFLILIFLLFFFFVFFFSSRRRHTRYWRDWSSDVCSSDLGAAIAGPYPVALLIVVIGMSLGGTTGYAINPARDLPPRIAHAILPVKNKRDSDWGYSWIPVIAPMVGGALAAWVYLAIF